MGKTTINFATASFLLLVVRPGAPNTSCYCKCLQECLSKNTLGPLGPLDVNSCVSASPYPSPKGKSS